MTRPGKTAQASTTPSRIAYALEQLYVDQHRDFVVDTVPAVLAWVRPGRAEPATQPFDFVIEHTSGGGKPRRVVIELTWDVVALRVQDPALADRASRMRRGKSPEREHVSELAAYGLALVAISALMPGRRVIDMPRWTPPDMLFDVTPGMLRGVEVAGRSTGGRAALLAVRNGAGGQAGKEAVLRSAPDIAEAHLSLWCADPRTAIMEQVKP